MVMELWYEQAWKEALEKLHQTAGEIGTAFPHVCKTGKYDNEAASWWTNGYWPGILWLAYRETKEENFMGLAQQIEEKMDQPLEEYFELHHDVGFMWLLSSVAQYRLNGNEVSKKRALKAAAFLASRFNPKGRFIRAWNQADRQDPPVAGWAIIDCMMNIPLLFWASEMTGDPRYRHVACAHADTVLKEFIRKDGSSHHIVCFDPESGKRICALGGQGYGPDSAWSRGCGWAIYGMALAYQYTGNEKYLKSAKKSAAFFMEAMGDQPVPYWDFRAPVTENTPWDASAAGIAACGMLEIAKYTRSKFYARSAELLLKNLYEHCYCPDPAYQGLILHATGNNERNHNVDVSLIYGDYYYLEGLLRLQGRDRLF